jgi:drug/metabolite transporter (DMT)-like permease
VLIAGIILALVCGLANAAAAAIEKRESVRLRGRNGVRLLAQLLRRGWWLMAMGLSVLAWVSEAAALALAPVAVVATLRSTGRGGLVLVGARWLGERFTRRELVGVVLLAVGGVVVAIFAGGAGPPERPLSNAVELELAGAILVLTLILRLSRRGIVAGAAVGVLYAATGIYTKEIGDRFARVGLHAVVGLAASPGPWLMIAMSVWAISVTQAAFRRANAASVSAASTTVAGLGLIFISAGVYSRPLAAVSSAVPFALGLVLSAAGAVLLAVGSVDRDNAENAPRGDERGAQT